MAHASEDKAFTLPVEVEAVLWADAYRDTLRPALAARLAADELAVLDEAINRIELGVFEGKPKLALSA